MERPWPGCTSRSSMALRKSFAQFQPPRPLTSPRGHSYPGCPTDLLMADRAEGVRTQAFCKAGPGEALPRKLWAPDLAAKACVSWLGAGPGLGCLPSSAGGCESLSFLSRSKQQPLSREGEGSTHPQLWLPNLFVFIFVPLHSLETNALGPCCCNSVLQ